MKFFMVIICAVALVTAQPLDTNRQGKQGFLGGLLGAAGTASLSKSGGAGINVLGVPLVGVNGGYAEAVGVGHEAGILSRGRRDISSSVVASLLG